MAQTQEMQKDCKKSICPCCNHGVDYQAEWLKCPVCGQEFCGHCIFRVLRSNSSPKFRCLVCGTMLRLVNLSEKYDKCVKCGNSTKYSEGTPAEKRLHYVEGLGQFCPDCYVANFGFCRCAECTCVRLFRQNAFA